jgi:GNAT superfamily N-acetyltransferase
LNLDWINHYWEVEDADCLYLDHPQEKILAPGGAILMALYDGEAVGTVALIPMEDRSYGLAEMAVDERARGKGIGWLLGRCVKGQSICERHEPGFARAYSAAKVPSNPLALWVPSQKGFRLDAPQRHKLYGFPVGIVSVFPS